MKKLLLTVLLALGILPLVAYSQTPASAPTADTKAIADQIMDITGTTEGMKQAAEFMAAGFSQQISQNGGTADPKVIQLIKDTFKSDDMLQSMRQFLVDRFDAKKAQDVLTWYQTPVGKKVVADDIHNMKPEAVAEEAEFKKGMINNPPTAAQLDSLKALDKAIHATSDAIDGGLMVQEAMLRMSGKFDEAKLKQVMDMQRKQMEMVKPAETISSLMFRYKDLSADELKAYIDFSNTDAGQWVITTLSDGVKTSLKNVTTAFATQFGEIMKNMSPEDRAKMLGPEPSDDLYKVDMENGRFTVVFTKFHTDQTFLIQMQGDYGQTRLTNLQGQMKTLILNVTYMDYPEKFVKDTGGDSLLKQSLDNLVKRLNAEVVSSKAEPWKGDPAMNFQLKGPMGVFIDGRFILDNNMVVQLSTFSEKDNVEKNRDNVKFFLDSLEFHAPATK